MNIYIKELEAQVEKLNMEATHLCGRLIKLESQLDNVKEICSGSLGNFVAVNDVLKALESPAEQPEQ